MSSFYTSYKHEFSQGSNFFPWGIVILFIIGNGMHEETKSANKSNRIITSQRLFVLITSAKVGDIGHLFYVHYKYTAS